MNGSPQASSSLVKQELREKLLSSVGSGGGRLGASVPPLAAQPQSRDDFLSFIDFDSLPHDIHSNSSELPLDVLESRMCTILKCSLHATCSQVDRLKFVLLSGLYVAGSDA